MGKNDSAVYSAFHKQKRQRPNGIPTHWMLPSCIEDGGDMWINCMIETAMRLSDLADYLEKDVV